MHAGKRFDYAVRGDDGGCDSTAGTLVLASSAGAHVVELLSVVMVLLMSVGVAAAAARALLGLVLYSIEAAAWRTQRAPFVPRTAGYSLTGDDRVVALASRQAA